MERRHHKSAHLGGYTLPRHPSQPPLPDGEDGAIEVGRQRVEAVHIPGEREEELQGGRAGMQGRGLYQPSDPVTQGPGDAVKRGPTREATPRVRVRSSYCTLVD